MQVTTEKSYMLQKPDASETSDKFHKIVSNFWTLWVSAQITFFLNKTDFLYLLQAATSTFYHRLDRVASKRTENFREI